VNNITIKKSRTTKRLRIVVHADGQVVVSAPRLLPDIFVRRFIHSRTAWINEKVEYFKKLEQAHPGFRERYSMTKTAKRKEFLENKEKALTLVRERLIHFNKFYNFTYHNVTIRNQKTRWGSCSKRGNLNFNYKILFLTPEQQNYIIVHELCHLAHMNHGPKFWALVAECVPEYKTIRSEIKKFRL